MKKQVIETTLAICLGLIFILSGCRTGTAPEQATSTTSVSEPAESWKVGGNLSYSQEPIWGDTLVGLEFNLANPESKDGRLPKQNIIVYDLKTREQKRTIAVPEGRMAGAPSIYGNKVVFAAADADEYFRRMISSKIEPPPNYDIFLFDMETNELRQLTTEEHAQMSPLIYGDSIVWLDARSQPLTQYPPPFDIYALNLKTNRETRITANTTAEGYIQLALSGSLVVWSDMRHADASVTNHPSNAPNYNNEIYLYDLDTNLERRLTTSPGNDRCPDIDGNRVVWLRQEEYQKADVFMYDLESDQEIQISHSSYANSSLSIYGDRIVWADASSSKGNTDSDVIINGQLPESAIVLFDLKTQKETQLTPTESGKVCLLPVIHGSHAVYTEAGLGGVYALELKPDAAAMLDRLIDTSTTISFFPAQKEVPRTYMCALANGRLVQDKGELRLERRYPDGRGDNVLLVWPYGYSYRITDNKIQVFNSVGSVIATVGDNIKVGGGEVSAEAAEKFIERPLPDDCVGPYWLISEIVP